MSNTKIPKELYGIIGYPLDHTLSPLLHNWGFAELRLAKTYLAFPTPLERLQELVKAVRTLPVSGLSVTIPHKEAVMGLVDRVDARAASVGAVNTLYWDADVLAGENTDVAGFLEGLAGIGRISSALVLGSGGAARAVLAGLREMGVATAITNRSPERAQVLADEFGVEFIDWDARGARGGQLLVNATPLGMRSKAEEATPWEKEWFEQGHIAYDLVYNPLETRFLREARESGCKAVDGLTMFLGQAREQFRLWTGHGLPPAARSVLEQALAKG